MVPTTLPMKMRARMRSEVWRHAVILTCTAILGFVSGVAAGRFPAIDALDGQFNLMVGLLVGLGFYGPGYLLLSRYAWRGLRGKELRGSLQATRPPTGRLVRDFLIGGPTQWAVAAALFSVFAVMVLALIDQLSAQPALIAICLWCVSGSWILLVASFSVEYAREWATSSGLRFPDEESETRTFGDFIYTAVQVSTTFSTSDVSIMNQRTRRLVTVNAIAAFCFSTVIIALLVAMVLSTVM